MSQIETIKVGGANGVVYNLSADELTTPRSINGVEFDGTSDIANFATCATDAATAAKVVTVTGFSLAAGAMVRIKFTAGNTVAAPTLNVNSSGAKAIVEYGSTAAGSAAWAAGEIVDFCYDGTNWVMVSGATGNATVRGKVIVDAVPTSGSTNAAQSGGTADAIAAMTDAAYITQNATGTAYTYTSLSGTTETGYQIAVDDAADNIPVKSLQVGGTIDNTATQLTVTAEAETVHFNQLVKNGDLASGTSSWGSNPSYAVLSASGGVLTLTLAATSGISANNSQAVIYTSGHKFFSCFGVQSSRAGARISMTRTTTDDGVEVTCDTADTWYEAAGIFTAMATTNAQLYLRYRNASANGAQIGDTLQFRQLMIVDLTAIFGAGNEPTTAEEVRALLPEDYYDYTLDTLMSRAYGQTAYGTYLGQNYTVTIPAEAIPSASKIFRWYPTTGALQVQGLGNFTVPTQNVTTYLGNTRIYCENSTGVTYSAEAATYRLDPTIAYENLRSAIVSLGGNV